MPAALLLKAPVPGGECRTQVWGLPVNPAATVDRLARLAGRVFWVEPEDLVFANELGTLAVRRAEVPGAQAWMGHSDIQTTMRLRPTTATAATKPAFRPAGTFGGVSAGTSPNVAS